MFLASAILHFMAHKVDHIFILHFQNEDRTLWEATSTYVEMSPFMSANKIKKPILLIHGEEDNNPGTLTMQVCIVNQPISFPVHSVLCTVVLVFRSCSFKLSNCLCFLSTFTARQSVLLIPGNLYFIFLFCSQTASSML